MRYKYRITKYNPSNRDATGGYLLDDWTSNSDIGSSFGGTILSEAEYNRVEDAYVLCAVSFLRESGIHQLVMTYLENHGDYHEPGLDLKEGQVYSLQELERLFRLVLRETIWGKFEWHDLAYVHFGYDYYMYLGVNQECPKSTAYAVQHGLFVEDFESPSLKSIE